MFSPRARDVRQCVGIAHPKSVFVARQTKKFENLLISRLGMPSVDIVVNVFSRNIAVQ